MIQAFNRSNDAIKKLAAANHRISVACRSESGNIPDEDFVAALKRDALDAANDVEFYGVELESARLAFASHRLAFKISARV